MISLNNLFREVGIVTLPSVKGEVTFEMVDGDLWVVYTEHKPDGTYTDAITHKFVLSDD